MRTVSYSRSQIHRFYEMPRSQRGTLLEKSASSASSHPFKGAGLYNTAVVRVDLNNYSAWTRRVPITDRVELLDHFFTTTVSLASQLNGVYFRDEGDCVVLLFGSYFGATSFQEMHYFCRQCVLRKFGRDELDAKVSVAIGEVAFFQKSHELNSTDWSAEGEPFVRSARLEQAVSSIPRINFYADQFDAIHPATFYVPKGSVYIWQIDRLKMQVPGLGAAGGWVDVVTETYVPEGRVQD